MESALIVFTMYHELKGMEWNGMERKGKQEDGGVRERERVGRGKGKEKDIPPKVPQSAT